MKWRLKTASMFVVMTLILIAVGTLVGSLFNDWALGLIIMLAISIAFNLYAYFCSKKSALRANKVRLVTEAEEPKLYAIVRKVAEKADIPMPEVGVSEVYMPNAFATGRSPKDAAVVATRGLLQILPDDELEGVLAHEISHVKNRDILVMSVASTMASVLSVATRFALIGSMMGDNRNSQTAVIAMLLYVLVPIAALMVQLGVSRNREYLADETGAKITGNPRALARALRHIETGCGSPKNDYSDNSYADMWISNPVRNKKSSVSSWFSTHPSTDERVRRLNELADKMGV